MSEQEVEALPEGGKTEQVGSTPPAQEWAKVGRIGIDVGLLWLGDPCYIFDSKRPADLGKDWDDFCERMFARRKNGVSQWNHGTADDGFLGLSVDTGLGDGFYDVFVKRVHTQFGARIAEVKVVFMAEENGEVGS